MSKTTNPITVAELTERLNGLDPSTVVMIECQDEYYSGPVLTDDLATGEAALIGPHQYMTPAEDARGQPVQPTKRTAPGGWVIMDEDQTAPVLEKRPAFILRAHG